MNKLEINGEITDEKIENIKEFLNNTSDNQVKIEYRTGTEVKLNEVVERNSIITQFVDDNVKILLEIKLDETLNEKEIIIELRIAIKLKSDGISASVIGIITDALVIFAYRQVILLKAVIFCYAKLYLPIG